MQRTLARGIGLLLLCAALPLRPCAAQLEEGGPTLGARAPVAVTTDLDGRRVDLADYLGRRPVLIEFWATWCVPCQELMPKVDTAFAHYSDRVTFLGVNVAMNETVPGVREWVLRHRPGFQVWYDSSAAAIRAYDIQATSTVIIVGADGLVKYAGVGSGQDLEAALKRLFPSVPAAGSN